MTSIENQTLMQRRQYDIKNRNVHVNIKNKSQNLMLTINYDVATKNLTSILNHIWTK